MNTSYKKILNKSKLLLSDFDTDSFSQNYMIKMLINNNISGLLSTELNMVNSNPMLSYDITSKHSVISVLENKKVDYCLFSSIIQGLHRLCYTLNDFMLDNCYLLLSPEYIFLDGGMQQTYFCYCPVCEKNNTYSLSTQLRLFLEYIISKLNYDDRDCVAHVYSLHQKCIEDNLCIDDLIYNSNETYAEVPKDNSLESYNNTSSYSIDTLSANTFCTDDSELNSNDDIFINNNTSYIYGFPLNTFFIIIVFGIISLFTILLGLYMYFIRNSVSPALAAIIFISGPITLLLFIPSCLKKRVGKNTCRQSSLKQSLSTVYPLDSSLDAAPFGSANLDDFSAPVSKNSSIHIMPIGETVLINPNHTFTVPHLVYNGNDFSENVELTIFPFTIGKLSDSVNHIMDNSLISRIHARFYLKEDCYYIEDLNSSNGTYINNVPLSPHTLTEIHDGDYITFAHLTYIFKIC